jgi:hypothetical protein
MPKKKNEETAKQQAERFAAEVARMQAAGELNPTEADAALDRLMTHAKLRDT